MSSTLTRNLKKAFKGIAFIAAMQEASCLVLGEAGLEIIKSELSVSEWPAHALLLQAEKLEQSNDVDNALQYYKIAGDKLREEASTPKLNGERKQQEYVVRASRLITSADAGYKRCNAKALDKAGMLAVVDSRRSRSPFTA